VGIAVDVAVLVFRPGRGGAAESVSVTVGEYVDIGEAAEALGGFLKTRSKRGWEEIPI